MKPLRLPAVLLLSTVLAGAQAPRATPAPGWPFAAHPTPAPAKSAAATPIPVAAFLTDRTKLLEGVKSLPRLGAPGPVVAYGAEAFALIAAGGKAPEAVAAAGPMGKGRVVIFGHTGYLEGDAAEGDLGRLLLNAVHWCGGKEKPRIGLKGAKCAELLKKAGLPSENFRRFERKELAGCDVVIGSAQDLTDPAEAAALKEFIEQGGGYLGAMTGWAFGQTSKGKDFATASLGNSVLAGAGLAWTTETLAAGPLEAPAEPAPLLNAASAIAALQPRPGSPLAPEALEQASRTIQLALSSMPAASRPALQKLLAGTLAGGSRAVPTAEKPLTASDGEARAQAALEARLSRFLSPAETGPHPAAASFPGRPAATARVVTKTIAIDPAIPGWQSTGLYADAGAAIRVTLPPELAGQGYGVRIGCHTDALYHLEQWKRIPEITTTAPLNAAETTAASAFGGLIYLTVPEKAKTTAPFHATIAGGVEAPLFVLGQTTEAQWLQMVQSAAPWAELACKGVILSVPIAAAREVKKPVELMTFWQRVVDAEDELANTAAQRRRPERIVSDVQISAGFMHSGYPIMVFLPQAHDMVTLAPGKWPGWGFYHELGHNHQDSAWTFAGTVEVTCNLFSLYVVDQVEGRPMRTGHNAVTVEAQDKKLALHLRGGAPFELWKGDPFLALGMYIQLIEGFGFEPLKEVFHSYQGSGLGPKPATEEEKRDQWMVRYAKITGRNLGPFFEAWGIPVSAAAKAGIAQLPEWLPPGMK